jgi:hypothetical protein
MIHPRLLLHPHTFDTTAKLLLPTVEHNRKKKEEKKKEKGGGEQERTSVLDRAEDKSASTVLSWFLISSRIVSVVKYFSFI